MGTGRKLIAIGCCGLAIGGVMSVFGASSAGARAYAMCDQQLDAAEAQAAKDHKRGRLSDAQYAAVMAQIASHRQQWGC